MHRGSENFIESSQRDVWLDECKSGYSKRFIIVAVCMKSIATRSKNRLLNSPSSPSAFGARASTASNIDFINIKLTLKASVSTWSPERDRKKLVVKSLLASLLLFYSSSSTGKDTIAISWIDITSWSGAKGKRVICAIYKHFPCCCMRCRRTC